MEIEEKGVKLRLTIVDTPGFNDAVDARLWCVMLLLLLLLLLLGAGHQTAPGTRQWVCAGAASSCVCVCVCVY